MSVRWRAPGRVNFIGEHTDYNDGFALPFAIEAGCSATVSRRADDVVEVSSAQRDDAVRVRLSDLEPGVGGWAGYALGVLWAVQRRGSDVPALQISLDSDLPVGAGLSSSAALVCSVATAVNDLLDLALSGADLLAVTRSAENDFVGAPTGGMDQLVSLRGAAGSALFCDMRSLTTEQVPLPLEGMRLLVVDSRAEHRHADGEYRRRREGCRAAADALGVPALRDVELDGLDAAIAALDDDELRRYTRHVVTEDARVLATVELLRAGRLSDVGPLLTASHASMRDDYQITIPQIDMTVDVLLESGAVGARMTGGGFGGCVLALLDAELVDDAVESVRRNYAAHDYGEPACFCVTPSRGAHRLP